MAAFPRDRQRQMMALCRVSMPSHHVRLNDFVELRQLQVMATTNQSVSHAQLIFNYDVYQLSVESEKEATCHFDWFSFNFEANFPQQTDVDLAAGAQL